MRDHHSRACPSRSSSIRDLSDTSMSSGRTLSTRSTSATGTKMLRSMSCVPRASSTHHASASAPPNAWSIPALSSASWAWIMRSAKSTGGPDRVIGQRDFGTAGTASRRCTWRVGVLPSGAGTPASRQASAGTARHRCPTRRWPRPCVVSDASVRRGLLRSQPHRQSATGSGLPEWCSGLVADRARRLSR